MDLCDPVEPADLIVTQTGRRYAVVAVRVQTKGTHVGRQHLRCMVLGDGDLAPPGRMMHRIRWYRRDRRS